MKQPTFPVHLDVCANCGESVGVVLGMRSGMVLKREDGSAIEEHEKVSTGGLCDPCAKLQEEQKTIVDAGGIYFKCRDCGSEGAIRKTASICADVRAKLDIPAPEPCGVEFDKTNCPACSVVNHE